MDYEKMIDELFMEVQQTIEKSDKLPIVNSMSSYAMYRDTLSRNLTLSTMRWAFNAKRHFILKVERKITI